MNLSSSKYYFYGFLALLAAALILVPRGSTVLNTSISLAPDGKPVLGAVVDKKEAFSDSDSRLTKVIKQQAGIYGQSFEKRDYGFVVYYDFFYRFDLTSVPDFVPAQFVFSADMPGDIESVKGGSFQKSKVMWVLERGQNGDFSVTSKVVRWWLIALAGLAMIIAIYAIILGYQKSKA